MSDIVVIYADVLCPFTHVGLHTLIERRTSAGLLAPRFDIRAWPLELINGQPLDAHHIAAEIAGLRTKVSPKLFQGFSIAKFPRTSLQAFRLTAAAAITGDLSIVETVGLAVRDAVFERGIDVGEASAIEKLGEELGVVPVSLDEAQTAAIADWESGKARGVIGSPHIFAADGSDYFCPALDISRDDQGAFVIDWKSDAHDSVARILGTR